jgi:hypothetical protein
MPYADPEVGRARARERQKERMADPEYRERYREYHRTWQQQNPRRRFAANLKRLYGITPAEYLRMVVQQCGACAICGGVPSENPDADIRVSRLMVDHDHSTGAIRDLLCTRCNLMLGQARDSASRLRDGADYLTEWEG